MRSSPLLDGDALAQGKAFFRLGVTEHSPDHRLLVWLADEAGSELYTARVRVIETGADLADVVPDASGTAVRTQDASAFYYVRLDQDHRPAGVFRHRLGTPLAEDVRVFAQPDPGLLFRSAATHRVGLRTFRLTIMRRRKYGSLISPLQKPNRRSWRHAKPKSSMK